MRSNDGDGSGVSRRNYLGVGGSALAALTFASAGGAAESSANADGEDGDRTLIRDGTVVTVDPDLGVCDETDVLIEDGRIERIDRNVDAAGAKTIDASDSIVVPGFVNAHLHTWQAGVRGVAGDWSFMEYLETMLGEISSHYTPEDAYLGNLFGSLEQLNAGATTIMDWFHIANTPAHSDRAIDGLEDAGIRAVFAHGQPGDDNETWWEESTEPHPDDVRRLAEERFDDDDLLTLAMGIRGPDYATDEVVEQEIELARELDVLASMHIGSLGPGGVETLEELDLLGDDLNYVHGNRLTDEEFELIGESGGSVTTTPEVEMQMGMGMPPLRQTLEAEGAIPSIGVDIVSNVSGDMFTQTRTALQTQRALDNQPTVEAGEQVGELSISAREALELATIEGARALGLEDEIGSLTPGKRADVTMIRADDLNTMPVHDPIETVVFQSGVANVDTVLVDGEVVKRDGKLYNEPGRQQQDRLVRSGRRILEESGLGE